MSILPSLSLNSLSRNSLSRNSLSQNTLSQNTLSQNTLAHNSVAFKAVSKNQLQLNKLSRDPVVPASIPNSAKTFKQELNSMFKTMLKNQDQFLKMGESISQGKKFSPQELLSLQIRAGEMQVQVELCSKIADSVSGLVRRLHQGS